MEYKLLKNIYSVCKAVGCRWLLGRQE